MNTRQLNHINFSQKELNDLFKASVSGDSAAFGRLSGIVRQIAYSYFLSKHRQGKIPNLDDVDDLSNNVYLSFAEQYERIENLEFWLRRVLFLSFVSWYKKTKSKRSIDIEEAYYLKDTSPEPGETVDAQKILRLLDTLSEDKRRIIIMRFYEDLKFSEISENLGKSEDAVKKMFYRTIEELKSMITIVTFFLLGKL